MRRTKEDEETAGLIKARRLVRQAEEAARAGNHARVRELLTASLAALPPDPDEEEPA